MSDFVLTSPAFENGSLIPMEYTVEGKGINPPLDWADLPAGTCSLALEMIDYDIPGNSNGFVHWVLYGIPADAAGLRAGESAGKTGRNGAGRRQYYPPCPVNGEHAYTFRLFALDCEFPELDRDDHKSFHRALEGHLLGTAELVGRYRCQTMNDWQALAANLKMYIRQTKSA